MNTTHKIKNDLLNWQQVELIYEGSETIQLVNDGKGAFYIFQKPANDFYLRYKKDKLEIVSTGGGDEKVVFCIKLRKVNKKLMKKIVNELKGNAYMCNLCSVGRYDDVLDEDLFVVKFLKDDEGQLVFVIDDKDKMGEYNRFYRHLEDYYHDCARCQNIGLEISANTVATKNIDMNVGYLKDIFNETFHYAASKFVSAHNIDLDKDYLTKSFFIAFLHMLYDYVAKNFNIDAYLKQKLVDARFENGMHFVDYSTKTLYLDVVYNGNKYSNEIGITFVFSLATFNVGIAGCINNLHTYCAPVPVYVLDKKNKIYRYIGCNTLRGL